ncbi:glycerol-3-phosphate acyltransferase [Paenibacillus borealis]|uniref:Glycerol-3-phosphate acyltransferase n=2 Tax=Paenibacillus TaxID=44249 RepID=A0ABX3H2D4_PAEBO|nr:glycerol-3-phosphate acyltransferase [Paenibacillus borealis]
MLMQYWWQLSLIGVVSYFLGNICGAVIVSNKFMHKDIRGLGSKNAGTTNMARVFGVKYGVATLLIDLLKALICVLIAKVIMTSIGGAEAGRLAGYLSGCAVIVGHNYPLLLGLKGGKGFASGIGVFMALQPLFTLILLVCGLLMLLIVDRMSVFALTFFAVETIYAWMVVPIGEWWVPAFVTVYLLLAVIAHWPNLVRLAHGEEKPLGLYHLLKYGKRAH